MVYCLSLYGGNGSSHTLSPLISLFLFQSQKYFVCNVPDCGKRYTDPSSLRKHRINVHAMIPDSSSKTHWRSGTGTLLEPNPAQEEITMLKKTTTKVVCEENPVDPVMQEVHYTYPAIQEVHHKDPVVQEVYYTDPVIQEVHHKDQVAVQEVHHEDPILQEVHHVEQAVQMVHCADPVLQEVHHRGHALQEVHYADPEIQEEYLDGPLKPEVCKAKYNLQGTQNLGPVCRFVDCTDPYLEEEELKNCVPTVQTDSNSGQSYDCWYESMSSENAHNCSSSSLGPSPKQHLNNQSHHVRPPWSNASNCNSPVSPQLSSTDSVLMYSERQNIPVHGSACSSPITEGVLPLSISDIENGNCINFPPGGLDFSYSSSPLTPPDNNYHEDVDEDVAFEPNVTTGTPGMPKNMTPASSHTVADINFVNTASSVTSGTLSPAHLSERCTNTFVPSIHTPVSPTHSALPWSIPPSCSSQQSPYMPLPPHNILDKSDRDVKQSGRSMESTSDMFTFESYAITMDTNVPVEEHTQIRYHRSVINHKTVIINNRTTIMESATGRLS